MIWIIVRKICVLMCFFFKVKGDTFRRVHRDFASGGEPWGRSNLKEKANFHQFLHRKVFFRTKVLIRFSALNILSQFKQFSITKFYIR